ncbi:UNVERIFIED_CONTAM: hypothetical protein FKN15_007824 [Acipenser sinensis]
MSRGVTRVGGGAAGPGEAIPPPHISEGMSRVYKWSVAILALLCLLLVAAISVLGIDSAIAASPLPPPLLSVFPHVDFRGEDAASGDAGSGNADSSGRAASSGSRNADSGVTHSSPGNGSRASPCGTGDRELGTPYVVVLLRTPAVVSLAVAILIAAQGTLAVAILIAARGTLGVAVVLCTPDVVVLAVTMLIAMRGTPAMAATMLPSLRDTLAVVVLTAAMLTSA